ncbi:rRNA maturation RNase YbeY [Nocardioides convexus]|uniref:rRNA maturation RNase YbeY n=1 Tax=Nocardioides convexus TaxID=2712224 RepID=UPI0024182353|nr:rRNA maturation RNase YbeY [Nocardioides convexus]
MRVHPLAEPVHQGRRRGHHRRVSTPGGWTRRAPPTCWPSRWTSLRPGLVNEEPEEGVLGDLVLCVAVAERQGESAGHGTQAEPGSLTTHGILHLLGYDHAEPEEHKVMFGLQDQAPRAVARAPSMIGDSLWPLGAAAVLVVLAGLFAAADAALAGFSRARALEAPRRGARRRETAGDRPGGRAPPPQHRAAAADCCARSLPSSSSRSTSTTTSTPRGGPAPGCPWP